jgi:glucokinase
MKHGRTPQVSPSRARPLPIEPARLLIVRAVNGSDSPKVIGIDIGGTKLLAGAIDEHLGVHRSAYRIVQGLDQQKLLDTIFDAIAEIRETEQNVQAIGFGIPCLIDQRTGVAVIAANLPITDLPFREIMEERLDLPVFIDNDATVATLIEQRYGAAEGADNVVGLTIGTGIGGGMVLGGKVYRGFVGAAGELGHMVVDMDGPRCQGQCPNRGCLEAVASGMAIAREGTVAAKEEPDSALGGALRDGLDITGEFVTELALEGDEVARMVIGHIDTKLGVGLANIANIFNPEVIVLGGGALAAGELLIEPARDEMMRRALPPSRDLVKIVRAKFRDEAGMLGAAVLAFDELGERVNA